MLWLKKKNLQESSGIHIHNIQDPTIHILYYFNFNIFKMQLATGLNVILQISH